MKKALRGIPWIALMLCLSPHEVQAQYMYIDVDGDGVNTSADVLNPNGQTILTIYLNTNHDRDGSQQSCNSHTAACGASTTTQSLDMFGYTLALATVGGTVTWGTFTPSNAAYANSAPVLTSPTEIEINQFRPTGTFTSPGLVTVGTLPVTIVSGSPSIHWQQGPGALNPFGFGTGFATSCDGSNFTNFYVLGDPANRCGSGETGSTQEESLAGEGAATQRHNWRHRLMCLPRMAAFWNCRQLRPTLTRVI